MGTIRSIVPLSRHLLVTILGILAVSSPRPAAADTFTETYYFTTGGIAASDTPGNAFKDRSPGPDMLPYTDDDEDLLEGGNTGGTWTFAALDIDGDGVPERLFSCTRRGDDDAYTLTSYSDFQHGIFAEGEDWIDLHDAFNSGPSGDGSLGIDPGDDFEWNDSPNWEGQSNWFLYNNAAANQRGLGGSRYYFELRNPEIPGVGNASSPIDEVQQWVKTVNLKANADDPTTAFNEKTSFASGKNLTIKGLLIPVAAIPALKDGELDPLFGWYPGDMAKYVREVLGPKLEDPNLAVFQTDEGGNYCGTTHNLLPPTYLMIEEAEFHVTLLLGSEQAAAYWGITPINAGESATTAILRWSRIMLKGDDDIYEDDAMWNPPIQLIPDDGSRENLWRRDKFVRETVQGYDPLTGFGTGLPDSWGALQLGCEILGPDPDSTPPDNCWFFLREYDTQGLPMFEDCQVDYVLSLFGGSGPDHSWFTMPLTQPLDASRGKVRAEVRLRVKDPSATANRIQVILTASSDRDDPPIAWLDLKDGGMARAGVGGHFSDVGDGPVEEGTALPTETSVSLSSTEGTYSTLELILDAKARTITTRIDGTDLVSGTYPSEFTGSLVGALRLWTESGPGDENQIYVNDISVLQEFPHPFIRGEANCDAMTDISDAVAILSYLFIGGGAPCCLAATDVDDDGKLDISDSVALLGFLFLGGATPPQPYPACGVDPATSFSCDQFAGCP